MLRRLNDRLPFDGPRPQSARGVSLRALRSGWTATNRSAKANGSFRHIDARRRLAADSGEPAGAAPRRLQSRRLAGVRQALRSRGLWLRPQAGPARRRRRRSDAGRHAFGFHGDWPPRLRPQSGDVPRLAVHDHAQQDLQFSLGAPHPAAGIGRLNDESIAAGTPRRERRGGRVGTGVPAPYRGARHGARQGGVSREHVAGGSIYVARSRVLARLKEEVETMQRQEES